MIDLATALTERPVILDGGLGTLLEARGNDVTSDLWSARVLRDDPDEVRAAHAEFVAAGAEVVITASYQIGFAGRIPDAEVEALLHRSVAVAREAGAAVVAASVGPVGALRADGSEYTGAYGLSLAELREAHRRRLHVLADAGADVLAIETIPSPLEVEALALELAALDMPAFVSLSADSTGFAGRGRSPRHCAKRHPPRCRRRGRQLLRSRLGAARARRRPGPAAGGLPEHGRDLGCRKPHLARRRRPARRRGARVGRRRRASGRRLLPVDARRHRRDRGRGALRSARAARSRRRVSDCR